MPIIDVVRTYLEMSDPSQLQGADAAPADVRLERVIECTPGFFRFLYAEVGRDLFWRDRLAWNDDQIRKYLAGPVWTWVLYLEGQPAGYFELQRHDDHSVEIAYFGLMPHAIGRGLGRYLLTRAVQEGWALGPTRVWLHTCTLDHASALPNYLKRGFRAVRDETYQTTIP